MFVIRMFFCERCDELKILLETICDSYLKKIDKNHKRTQKLILITVHNVLALQRIDEANTKFKAKQENTPKFNSDIVYPYVDCTYNNLAVIKYGNK